MEHNNGLRNHNDSTSHQDSVDNWKNFLRTKTSVTYSLNEISDKQKRWLFGVFNVVRYLSANGLPFRGTSEGTIDGDGLFLRTFSQLIFPMDESWVEIHKNLPQNAKYNSPTIQNEVISVLAELVKEAIAAKIKAAGVYTIMADGTYR